MHIRQINAIDFSGRWNRATNGKTIFQGTNDTAKVVDIGFPGLQKGPGSKSFNDNNWATKSSLLISHYEGSRKDFVSNANSSSRARYTNVYRVRDWILYLDTSNMHVFSWKWSYTKFSAVVFFFIKDDYHRFKLINENRPLPLFHVLFAQWL